MDPITLSLIAAGGSGLLTKLLNPGKGYKKAEQAMQPYYNQSQQYLSPYHQQGQQAYGQLNGAMQQLLNPEQLYDRFANSYQTSDATRRAQERAQQSSLDAANAMGLGGATTTARALTAENQAIESNALQDYIKMLTGQYLEGAHLAQGIYGQGAGAAGQLGQNAMNQGQNMAS